ncbi:MAG: hypothetical protein U0487_01385 [Patescibacteria group bacterium]
MAITEYDVVDKTVEGKEYRVDKIPPGERDSRVSAAILCRSDGWSYEGSPNPKRAELCIAYYLAHKTKPTAAQLRWCASIGLGFGLSWQSIFDIAAADPDKLNDVQLGTLHVRVKAVIEELVRLGDRNVANMARRSSKAGKDMSRIFPWVQPSSSGVLRGVSQALETMKTGIHNVAHFADEED